MTKYASVYSNSIVLLLWTTILVVSFPSWPVLDNFEAPKRAIISLLPLYLLFSNAKQWKNTHFMLSGLLVCCLLGWFTFSQGHSGIRDTEIWLSWSLPLIVFAGALMAPSSLLPVVRMGLAWAGMVQAVFMIFQHAGITPFSAETSTPGAAMIGTIGYHNQAASFLFICAGILLIGSFDLPRW